ncbi:MAG TPA: methyl-accepting chemotaxis protein, partial [Mobilitalea sp.]|nr:methyl-accepting chemotaxis protein [Mobilitalea sp.]
MESIRNILKKVRILSIFNKMFRSIRVKLTVFFLVPVIFIVILGATAYTSSSKAIINTFTEATVSSIVKTSEYYQLALNNIEDKVLQFTNDVTTKDYYSGEYNGDVLEEGNIYKSIRSNATTMANTDRFIDNITIFTNYGRPTTSFGSFEDSIKPYENFANTDEGKLIDSKLKVNYWTGYHSYIDENLDIESSKYGISLSKQFLNTSSKPIGYIITDISMVAITDAIKTLDLPDNSHFAFISPDGREITAEGDVNEPIFTNQQEYENAVNSEDTEKISNYSYMDYAGEEQLFIYSKIGTTGAMVCAMIPSAYLTAKAAPIKNLTMILVLIASVTAVAIGIFVAFGIARTIKKMIHTLSEASNGDLTATLHIGRKDEFGILSDSINSMIINMKELIIKASHVGRTVIESTKNVAENSELLLISSKDITAAISEIQQGNVQQAEDTEQCLKLTDDLSTQINMVYENSTAIEQIAVDTKNVVKDGIKEVSELTNVTNENIKVTKDTIRDIEELELESKAITEIIEVINDIAEQTNLLSLNASIEAARAGDAGRGFSVVADEIRNLSNKSVTAATEIEQIIRKITAKTKTTVKTVKQAEVISKSTEVKLTNVVNLFHDINVRVDDLANKLDKISEGIDDINKSKNETLGAIESISAVAEETSAASQEVDATAQQQLESVMRLNQSAKSLDRDAADL